MDTLFIPTDTIVEVSRTILIPISNKGEFSHALIISILVVISGILGGTINYLSLPLENQQDGNITKKGFFGDRELYLQLLLGICGAGLIPLFLHITDSKLFTQQETILPVYFIFFGYCVIGAVFSRAILNSLSSKIFNLESKLKNVENKVNEVAKEQNKESIEPDENIEVVIATTMPESTLFDSAEKVLENMQNSKYRDRSISGLSKGTKLDPETISKVIRLLEDRGIVVPIMWYGNYRYRLTEEGKNSKLVRKAEP